MYPNTFPPLRRFFSPCPRLLASGLLSLMALLAVATPAQATRIKEVAAVQGVRSNPLTGYGLVVGLDGTGDQTTQAPFTGQSLTAMLQQFGVLLPQGVTMQPRNVAAVMITTQLPPFAQPGQPLDVVVSSMGNAKSLRGGTLIATPLRGADGQVYAIAQGNLIVGGAGASAGGSKVQINHLSAGRIPNGALVERSVPTPLQQNEFLQLDLNASDFGTARAVARAINKAKGEGTAQPLDGRVVRVRAPLAPEARVAFLADMEKPADRSGHPGRPHRHQCPDRLGGDEPGGHPLALRRGARQPGGDHLQHPAGQPAQCALRRPDHGDGENRHLDQAGPRHHDPAAGRHPPQ